MLIEEKLINVNYSQGRFGYKPEGIVIHIAEGWLEGGYSWFKNPASQVSSHYMIGKDGRVWQFVRDEDTAWHAGITFNGENPTHGFIKNRWGINPNLYTIGIEHEGFTGEIWTDAQKKSSYELIAHLCKKWNIPCDYSNIIGHGEVNSRDRAMCPGMGVHLTYDLINPAKALLNGVVNNPVPSNLIKLQYTVVSGDYLEGIAQKLFGNINRVYDLISWNQSRYSSLASNPDYIEVGWTLDYYVPATSEDEPVVVPNSVKDSAEYKELIAKYENYKAEKEEFYKNEHNTLTEEITAIAQELLIKQNELKLLVQENDELMKQKQEIEQAYKIENNLPIFENIAREAVKTLGIVESYHNFIDSLAKKRIPFISKLAENEKFKSLLKYDWAYILASLLIFINLNALNFATEFGISQEYIFGISAVLSVPFKWLLTSVKNLADKNQDGFLTLEDTTIIKQYSSQ